MTAAGSSALETRNAAALGFATQLLIGCERRGFRIASLWAFLWPAIRLNQIAFSYNSVGRPIAFVTWAFLTETVSAEVERDCDRLLHLDEWNEGADLWIMDVVAPCGGAAALLRQVARDRFTRHNRIRAVRRLATGEFVKMIDIRRDLPNS